MMVKKRAKNLSTSLKWLSAITKREHEQYDMSMKPNVCHLWMVWVRRHWMVKSISFRCMLKFKSLWNSFQIHDFTMFSHIDTLLKLQLLESSSWCSRFKNYLIFMPMVTQKFQSLVKRTKGEQWNSLILGKKLKVN